MLVLHQIDGPVSANGYTWYEVSYGWGAYSGWVAGDYLVYVTSGGFYIGQTPPQDKPVRNVDDPALDELRPLPRFQELIKKNDERH